MTEDNENKAEAEERDYLHDKAIEAAKEQGRMEERERAEGVAQEEKPIDETAPPPALPEQTFTRYEFGTMPGVILIVPDNTPPSEMIRIGATVAEEIGLLMLRKTNNALMVALLK